MTAQELAIKGVCFIAALAIAILCTIMVGMCINRERDKEANFWMVVSVASGLLAIHFSQYFV